MGISERQPKILILGEASVVHSRRWAGYFRQRGWTVRWLSFPPIPPDSGAEPITKARYHRAIAVLLNAGNVRRLIDTFRPDIVSALFLPDYGWLANLCRRHPLAVSAWGSDVLIAPHKSRLHRWRIVSVLRHADLIFADADLLGREMVTLGASPGKIDIVPLGVEDSWLALGDSRDHASPGPIRVLTDRRLEPLYRVETLIRAAADPMLSDPAEFDFCVVGDGSMKDKHLRLSRNLGLGDRLRFVGFLPEERLQTLVAKSEIYVSCASSDGTSVSMLEAMAAGCVPIVTDLTVNREWIEPGVNGLVFPVGDHGTLATMIRRAASDPAWMKTAAARNREIIRRRARWRDNMATVEDAMIRVIRASRPNPGSRP